MSKKRAVLIDDSKLARFALTKQLKDQGLKVEAFESAEQGLAYLETEPADAVFMDHLMPGMDGLEATRAIRRNPDTANIPVVLCTSNDSEEHRRAALEAGAVDLLPKPVDPSRLTEVLARIAHAESVPQQPPAAGTADLEALVTSRVRGLLEGDALRALVAAAVETRIADLREELESLRQATTRLSQTPPVDEEALLETAEANATRIVHEALEAREADAGPQIDARLQQLETRVTDLANARGPTVDPSAVVEEARRAALESVELRTRELVADREAAPPAAPDPRIDALSNDLAGVVGQVDERIEASQRSVHEEVRRLLDERDAAATGAAPALPPDVEERLARLESTVSGVDTAPGDAGLVEQGLDEVKRALGSIEGRVKLYAAGAALIGIAAALFVKFT